MRAVVDNTIGTVIRRPNKFSYRNDATTLQLKRPFVKELRHVPALMNMQIRRALALTFACRPLIERPCHQRCADISSAGAGVMSNRSKESEVRKTESKLSLTHLNAALTSEISIPAKQLLILTRCPVEVVPGLELPDQLYTSINGSMWTESPRSQKYPNIPIMDAYATSYNCPANCVLALNQT